jgi:hypothetical protein
MLHRVHSVNLNIQFSRTKKPGYLRIFRWHGGTEDKLYNLLCNEKSRGVY